MQILYFTTILLERKNPQVVLVLQVKLRVAKIILCQERKLACFFPPNSITFTRKQTLLPYLVSIYLPESSSLGLLCVLGLDVVSDELLVLHGVASCRSRSL